MDFEAYDLLHGVVEEAIADQSVTVDFFAYDLNEPELVAKLAKLKGRLRAIVDNSTATDKKGVTSGYGTSRSAESHCSTTLKAAGATVHRTHFSGLQHNKVLVLSRGGVPYKVLTGSMNFSFRGIYIQSNNVIVFTEAEIAKLYADVFDVAWRSPAKLRSNALTSTWHRVQSGTHPPISFCFSPHASSDLSLDEVNKAIVNATSSVFYNVAFLDQIKSGPTFKAFHALIKRPIFSYGVILAQEAAVLDGYRNLNISNRENSSGLWMTPICQTRRPSPTVQISLLAGWLSELHLASRSSRCSSSATSRCAPSVTSGPSRSCQLSASSR